MPCQLGLQLLMVLVGTSVGCGEEGYSASYYYLGVCVRVRRGEGQRGVRGVEEMRIAVRGRVHGV